MNRNARRSRRGFTILELTLALLVSTLVISSSFGLFRLMTRTNQVLAARAEQFVGIGAARMSMESAFGSLVLAAGGAVEQSAMVRPRLLLERRAELGGAQRLEVVVQRPPLPGLAPFVERPEDEEAGTGIASAYGQRDQGYIRLWDGRPIRGAFELEPELLRVNAQGLPIGEQTWRLVWRNLELGGEPLPNIPRQRTVLLEGIEAFDWSLFQDRQRKLNYQATRTGEIPAYAECRVRTSAGHSAEWLFELDWINGPVDRAPDLLAATLGTGAGPDGDGLTALFDEFDDLAEGLEPVSPPIASRDPADRPDRPEPEQLELPEPDEFGRRYFHNPTLSNEKGPK